MEAISIPHLPQRSKAGSRSRFFFWMALAMTATAFLGFTPTFWAPLSQGVPERIAVIAIHATVSFGWMLFLIYQTWLAATGHTARHRDTGMIGIALATMMIIFGGSAAINSSQRAAAAGYSEAGEAFMIVPMTALFLFAVLLIAALANVRRPAWHKRLMLAATAMLLDAAIARPYITFVMMGGNLPRFQGNVGLAGLPGPPPPVAAVVAPALISLLFIVAGMIHDRRTIGRVHPAYIWACGVAFTLQLLKIPFSETTVWHAAARFFVSLGA
jgi:hypothetical protein